MSDKKEKKRKRKSEHDDRRSKKLALITPVAPSPQHSTAPEAVKVTFVRERADELCPVIASAPGFSLPSNIPLKIYEKRNVAAKSQRDTPNKKSDDSYELLLHSSAHPRLDYSGREEVKAGGDGLLKHYIGIFDPNNRELQVLEAHKVVIRSTLRSETSEEAAATTNKPTVYSLRQNLGMEFGTKKAKKALASLTANEITKEVESGKANPLAAAVLDSIQASTASMPTRAEMQNAVDDSKPCPKPNLAAAIPAEVYTPKSLVGEDILRNVPVTDWLDAAKRDEDVKTHSRFVSKRLHRLAKGRDIKQLKNLKCLLLLIEFRAAARSPNHAKGGHGTKALPPQKILMEKLGVGEVLVELVKKKFSAGKEVTKWHADNLITHIAALALIIDNYDVDISDLKDDLRLETTEMARYFREIGCKIGAPTEQERAEMKITKTEAAQHKMARLRIPLELPKQRLLKSKGSRRR